MNFSDDALLRALQSWASDERNQVAKARRIAATVQGQIASEESRFDGLLLDLVERRASAQLHVSGERWIAGRFTTIGSDFVAITSDVGGTTLVRHSAILSLKVDTPSRNAPTPSSRTLDHLELTLGEVLTELSVDSVRIRFSLRGDQQIRSGEVFAVSDELCTLGLGIPTDQTLFVPLERFETLALA